MDDRQANRNAEMKSSQPNRTGGTPRTDGRKERFEALCHEAGTFKSPLRRAARFATAELLEISSHLADSIKLGFSGPVKAPKDLGRHFLSALGKLGSLHRSASRFAQLDEKLGRNSDSSDPFDQLEDAPGTDERGET